MYRQNQIPAAGFTRPDFVFGWLPGNPFTGNGPAISTPGGAAFAHLLAAGGELCYEADPGGACSSMVRADGS